MSIEEKAKAYDEALKRAKELIAKWTGKNKDFYIGDYSYIFPELHESEDEKIRKKLIETIGYFRSRGIDQQLCEEFLAWLEKQKEQKQTDLPAGFYVTLPDGKQYYAKEMRCNGMNIKVVEPKPSWKPSELEKGALRTAIHVLTDERSFPKAAKQLQNILDAFERNEYE